MSQLDNFIFYSIGEKALEIYETITLRKCSSFTSFCNIMKSLIESNNLNSTNLFHISQLDKYISDIYNLSEEIRMNYIIDFFQYEKYIKIELSIRMTNKCFKTSFLDNYLK
jgi:predicted RNA-binding protein with RPS1 domain